MPQEDNLTSLGIITVRDGPAEQVGAMGFFYPTPSVTVSAVLAVTGMALALFVPHRRIW